MNDSYDVLLAGYYGYGNLGDELLARATIELLGAAGVERGRIAMLSGNPAESEASHGVAAVDRWKYSAIRPMMRRTRALVLGGGGLFQDATSARSCAYYWGIVRLARLERCRTAALGQSVGPLVSPAAQWLTKNALAACDYISVRDEPSRAVVSGFGLGCETTPDLAFALDIPQIQEKGGVVLVNMRPTKDGKWSARVARIAARLRARDFKLRGVAFSPEDVEELTAHSELCGGLGQIIYPRSIEEFVEISGDAFCAVGTRLHFGIAAMCRGLFVVMAPYDPKVSGFASKWPISLLPDDDRNDDSVIMPLLLEYRLPVFDAVVPVRAARGELRTAVSGAMKRLLEGRMDG